MKEIMVS